nr:serine/arginine repetitive matrix protein 1-like [Aegilops tauschii subsp. strangulata]
MAPNDEQASKDPASNPKQSNTATSTEHQASSPSLLTQPTRHPPHNTLHTPTMPKTTPSRRWRRTLRRCRPVLKRQGFSPGSWSRRERKRTSTKPPRRRTTPARVVDAVAGEPARDFSRSSSAALGNPTNHGSGVQRPPATRSGEEERSEGKWKPPSDPDANMDAAPPLRPAPAPAVTCRPRDQGDGGQHPQRRSPQKTTPPRHPRPLPRRPKPSAKSEAARSSPPPSWATTRASPEASSGGGERGRRGEGGPAARVFVASRVAPSGATRGPEEGVKKTPPPPSLSPPTH